MKTYEPDSNGIAVRDEIACWLDFGMQIGHVAEPVNSHNKYKVALVRGGFVYLHPNQMRLLTKHPTTEERI